MLPLNLLMFRAHSEVQRSCAGQDTHMYTRTLKWLRTCSSQLVPHRCRQGKHSSGLVDLRQLRSACSMAVPTAPSRRSWGIAIFREAALGERPHAGAGILPVMPIDGHIASECVEELGREDPQLLIAHDVNRALIVSKKATSCGLRFKTSPRRAAARMCWASLITSCSNQPAEIDADAAAHANRQRRSAANALDPGFRRTHLGPRLRHRLGSGQQCVRRLAGVIALGDNDADASASARRNATR